MSNNNNVDAQVAQYHTDQELFKQWLVVKHNQLYGKDRDPTAPLLPQEKWHQLARAVGLQLGRLPGNPRTPDVVKAVRDLKAAIRERYAVAGIYNDAEYAHAEFIGILTACKDELEKVVGVVQETTTTSRPSSSARPPSTPRKEKPKPNPKRNSFGDLELEELRGSSEEESML
ncbi:hypothetical protein B0T17DRAFT_512108 [Bombardia bombarda]|uniref:Uncharacterized protein n=1 Tax=Bombardia bombarda TaxID=252184 RepID=A0AA39U422_9PEZI|nr:hypothetical protein B0T17DRAFT_512108 [Bombardia bombarda]